MGVTVLIGGQYGGEGKGSIMAWLARSGPYSALVKTGGPNSWHCYGTRGELHEVRMLPSGSSISECDVVFPPGSLVHVSTLFAEIEKYPIRGRLIIDPKAGIIGDSNIYDQQVDPFYKSVGSSRRGTGSASAERARRRLGLARDEPSLSDYIGDALDDIVRRIGRQEHILIEGGQGYGLSNYHGDYPYCTSRDTTAACFASQCGIGIKYVDKIIMVVKCFPTRNPEGRGRLAFELDVECLSPEIARSLYEEGGTPSSDGNKVRRVGLFDFDLLRRASLANTPTEIALTGLDRLATAMEDKAIRRHYQSIDSFIARIAEIAEAPVTMRASGPFVEDIAIVT
jgi:adenylosuccinate synthase